MLPDFTPFEAAGIAFSLLLIALIICALTLPKGLTELPDTERTPR